MARKDSSDREKGAESTLDKAARESKKRSWRGTRTFIWRGPSTAQKTGCDGAEGRAGNSREGLINKKTLFATAPLKEDGLVANLTQPHSYSGEPRKGELPRAQKGPIRKTDQAPTAATKSYFG